jgi:hypothetical protein
VNKCWIFYKIGEKKWLGVTDANSHSPAPFNRNSFDSLNPLDKWFNIGLNLLIKFQRQVQYETITRDISTKKKLKEISPFKLKMFQLETNYWHISFDNDIPQIGKYFLEKGILERLLHTKLFSHKNCYF